MVHASEAATEETGIDAEIIDLRTLLPLDLETIVASVKKDRALRVVHEATLTRVSVRNSRLSFRNTASIIWKPRSRG